MGGPVLSAAPRPGSPGEGQPAGNPVAPHWRFAIFLLATATGVLALRLLHAAASGLIPAGARAPAFMLVLAGGLLIGHAWTFQLAEPRAWGYVGLGREALRGVAMAEATLLGAAAIAVPVAALLAMGWLRFEPAAPGSSSGAALSALALLVPASLWEELFVRGFAFAILRERWGAGGALVATSLAFGGLHLLNAEATVRSVAVVTLAGIFLGLVLVRTGSLYAAWAAHLAWNAVLVVGLHATVSGVALPQPGYRLVDNGPDWATGGPWGPEGGVFAAAGLAVAAWTIHRRPSRRLEPGHE